MNINVNIHLYIVHIHEDKHIEEWKKNTPDYPRTDPLWFDENIT